MWDRWRSVARNTQSSGGGADSGVLTKICGGVAAVALLITNGYPQAPSLLNSTFSTSP
ncbi:hypothetical protein [Sodalis-like endosymbiont of Proechinophthirus fluctus]|uniref:hypothetical protein n=1 Tax=Sodalis-like endosymbiont of Proechinophthirus fluctus TaxID=1462730 RepID=UPI001FCBFF58